MKIYNNKNRNTIKMASIVMTATIGIVSVIGLTASVFNKPEKEPVKNRIRNKDTDAGRIRENDIENLKLLLAAYKAGLIKPE